MYIVIYENFYYFRVSDKNYHFNVKMNQDRHLKYLKTGMELVTDVSKIVLDVIDDEEEKKDLLDQLKGTMSDYIKEEIDYNTKVRALQATSADISSRNDENNNDVQSIYEKKLKLISNELKLNDYRKDLRFLRLENVSVGYKATRDDLESIINDESENNSVMIDPWTRKPITGDAVKNRRCGHVYDNGTVNRHLEKLEKSGKKLKCPVSACQNENIRLSDLSKVTR